jgi:hypothetical protein
MNSNSLQGIFSSKSENQMKNFGAKNQPITDLRKFINYINMTENNDVKPVQNFQNKQIGFLKNNKKLLKKKTLMDLLPNCDVSKLLNNQSDSNKTPPVKTSSQIMTTTMTMNKSENENTFKKKDSNYVDLGKQLNLISPVLDKNSRINVTPKKSLTQGTNNNNIIHSLEIKKNLNEISNSNDKQEPLEKSKVLNVQDKKAEKFKFILNREEREVLKLISNNKYSYEIEFESYEHLLRQNNYSID